MLAHPFEDGRVKRAGVVADLLGVGLELGDALVCRLLAFSANVGGAGAVVRVVDAGGLGQGG